MTKSGQNVNDIKTANRSLLLNLLYFEGAQSRKTLSVKSNLTAAAVTLIVTELILDGCVIETDKIVSTGKSGRKERLVDLNYESIYFLGVSIGTELFEVRLAGLDGKTAGTKIYSIDKHNILSVWRTIEAACDEMLKLKTTEDAKVGGIGITVRGIVDNLNGISINSYGILNSNCRIADELTSQIDLPVTVENNVRAMLIADTIIRHAKPVQSTLFIRYGPGIGGALLIGQKCYTGSSNRAIELGHICVEENGEQCVCGKKGCLESIISFDAILRKISFAFSSEDTPVLHELCQGKKEIISIATVFDAYESGDPGVVKVVDSAIKLFALTVSNYASLFDPDTVLLSSSVFANRAVVNRLQKEIGAYSNNEAPRYLISKTTQRLETYGAISVAINNFLIDGGQELKRMSQMNRRTSNE